jgi:hypothetical protein
MEKIEDPVMPVWLQIAGAIAGALLSYYSRYDDTAVKDLIKDVAYNVGLALERLSEISSKIDDLLKAISDLPDIERRIVYSQEIRNLNNTISAAIIQFKQINDAKPPISGTLLVEQIKHIYDNVLDARTKLEAFSNDGELAFAPLTAVMCPIAMLLEISLLYRLGRGADGLRVSTAQDYLAWVTRMLDPVIINSVATTAQKADTELHNSDAAIKVGPFGPAVVAGNGTPLAVYAVEHQIGSTIPWPFSHETPPRSVAEVTSETWLSLWAIITLSQATSGGDRLWIVSDDEPKFKQEVYARRASTDIWYTAKPPYTIKPFVYDSRDLQRFGGENTAQRVTDIENSALWRAFIIAMPKGKNELVHNNQARSFLRFADDVRTSLQSTQVALTKILSRNITISES